MRNSLRRSVYMENQPAALVLITQEAINNVAIREALSKNKSSITPTVQPAGVSSAINPAGLIFREGLEKRQPNGNQSDVESH